MKLYLIRHGIAAERGTYLNDEERPLVKKGEKKTRQVAQHLWQKGVGFDLILTSPLIRAKQTAQILQEEGLSPKIEVFPPLAPEGNIQDWLSWHDNNKVSYLALVGHQPNLGNWVEILVWGECSEKLIVKKAGVIGLKLPDHSPPLGNSELFLLSSPQWIL
ncbi:MAG: phosphohistidine phosphatase SixA [Spirulinaceae cyanobacterium]